MQKLRKPQPDAALTDAPIVGLRDRKKRRTRQAIRAAAIDLFTANGVAATTIEQIAAQADISPRTFFNYFDSKEEAVSLPYGLVHEASLRPGSATSLAALRSTCVGLARALEDDTDERDVLAAGVRLCLTEPVLADHAAAQRGRWEHLMLQDLEPTFDNRVLVSAAAGAFWAALADWALEDSSGSLVERVKQAMRHVR